MIKLKYVVMKTNDAIFHQYITVVVDEMFFGTSIKYYVWAQLKVILVIVLCISIVLSRKTFKL